MSTVPLQQLRRIVKGCWDDVVAWLAQKPRIFTLPHPEQQVLFELACRLRESIRSITGNSAWDRLYFDTAALNFGPIAIADATGRRPPIYVDTAEIFGAESKRRSAETPDLAIAVNVLRAANEILDLDEDNRPRHQMWMPSSMAEQGWLLEENVRQFDRLAAAACEGYVFVLYSNAARRMTAVDRREVASWASWQVVSDELMWASRHFRAR